MLVFATSMQAGTLAQFRTVFGDIEVELLDDKPATVRNFIRYVESGRYRDSFFHRCPVNPTTQYSDFVVQGGGYRVANRDTTNEAIVGIPTFLPIANEFGVGARYSNLYGTIAMAKLPGDTNSATSQWFFNMADNTFLDAANSNYFFTVFGRIVRGTNVLNVFRSFTSSTNATTNVVRNLGGVFNELPLLTSALYFSDLIFVDISLLKVRVQGLDSQAREISWNGVAGRSNYVEGTTSFPPQWQVLLATNGSGERMTFHDASPNAAARFYRVRVDY